MDRIKNGTYGIRRSFTQTHKEFSDTLRPMGGKDLKLILTCLYCNKWNKNNV